MSLRVDFSEHIDVEVSDRGVAIHGCGIAPLSAENLAAFACILAAISKAEWAQGCEVRV